MNLKKAYTTQKSNAKRRGVNFNLTYNEWLNIWEESGYLNNRGRKKGQYVMCRNGDCGSYAVENVFIGLCNENTSEGNKGKVLSEVTRKLIGESKIGVSRKDMLGKNNPMYKRRAKKVTIPNGTFDSVAEASREINIFPSTIHRRCANDNFPDWNYAVAI